MRVVYFGKFCRCYSTENYVAHALGSAGVNVLPVECSRPPTLDEARAMVERHRATIALFGKASPCRETTRLLDWCRKRDVLTVTWLWDLFWGYRRERPAHFKADLLFTTDGGHDAQFAAHGCNHAVLRQGIHQPEARRCLDEPHRHDVAFVGGTVGHPSRTRLIRWLRRTYGSRFIYHTATRGLRLNAALAAAKVVVGDSYPSPNYWSNRIYEVTGRGGFLLHSRTTGLEADFADGTHYVGYDRDDFNALKRLIDRYVAADAEREQIQIAGFEHCAAHHTYDHRARDLLEHIKAAVPAALGSDRLRHRDVSAVDKLMCPSCKAAPMRSAAMMTRSG